MDGSKPKDVRFTRLMKQIKSIYKTLHKVVFFHVLRENNKDADLEANKATLLSVGTLSRDGGEDWVLIP